MPGDTIYALSSGSLPSAIAVVRVSGPAAAATLVRLAGRLPPPRAAVRARLRDTDGGLLDDALLLWLPGPGSATGEDVAELHLHGGRATVAAVLHAIGQDEGTRPADPGEFTRRALRNGRLDLAQVEGLSDLLAAETERQRRAAMHVADGSLSRVIDAWQDRLLRASAMVEARIEFAEDQDEPALAGRHAADDIAELTDELAALVAEPPAERLHDGVRIVIAGPVNAGKSSLLNALVGREVAIATSQPGTTRDLIEAPVVLGGIACLLIDGAGLRDTDDPVERIGVARARAAIGAADLLLWLGTPASCPPAAARLIVHAQADRPERKDRPHGADIAVSALTGQGLPELRRLLTQAATAMLPREDRISVNARHRALLHDVLDALRGIGAENDDLLVAERLRIARVALDRITGRSGTEAMLDQLFARFCIGK